MSELSSGAVNADFYDIGSSLSPADVEIVTKVRGFVDDKVLPIINEYWEKAEFPFHILPALADLGVVGLSAKGYGCPGLSRLQTGLVAMELARGDGSLNTLNAVQSGLAMGSIYLLGSEEQKQRWLPKMARLELLGAFALTEPDHGSDSVALETTARRDGDSFVIDGAKRWIGLGHLADVVVVWARDIDDSHVKAFVVEKVDGRYPPGYNADAIEGKIAKRALAQADIRLDGVRVPVENRLHESSTFRDVGRILNRTRVTVAWEALGHAMAAYEAAVSYASQRVQFGRSISQFQLVQNKLANMLADLTAMQLMCFRAGALQDEDRLSNEQASLAKMFTADRSRRLCRDARDLLGGNGLLLDNHVARHLTDMEVVHTYEGTDFIQSLIVGREITGKSAFA